MVDAAVFQGLSWNLGRRRPAALLVPVHGQRARGRDDRRRHGRRHRLVHGPPPPDVRRAHALGDRLPRRRRGEPRRRCRSRSATSASAALGALALAAIAGSRRSLSAESAAIGSLQALALALGFLFVSLYHGVLNGLDSLLFGTFLGITSAQVTVLLVVAVVDGRARRARGAAAASSPRSTPTSRAPPACPCGLLGFGFLLVLGLSVAETSQITGALLVFALLVTPAATAHQLTSRPGARSRALGRDRARRHLARARARLLLDLPGRLLRHVALVRALRPRPPRAGALLADGAPARSTAGAGLMFAHEFMRNALVAGSFVGARLRPRRLLRRPPRAGVRRRRAQPRRVHRRARRRRARPRHPSPACSSPPSSAASLMGAARRPRARRRRRRSARFFAWTLGLGVLFLSIFTTKSSAGNGTAGVRVLFGSIFGLSSDATSGRRSLLASSRCVLAARDRAAAAVRLARRGGRRRPGRTGPRARARLPRAPRPRRRPGDPGRRRAAAPRPARRPGGRRPPAHRRARIADCSSPPSSPLGSVWLGLTLSYVFPTLPPSSMIIVAAVGAYVVALLATVTSTGGGSKPPPVPSGSS